MDSTAKFARWEEEQPWFCFNTHDFPEAMEYVRSIVLQCSSDGYWDECRWESVSELKRVLKHKDQVIALVDIPSVKIDVPYLNGIVEFGGNVLWEEISINPR